MAARHSAIQQGLEDQRVTSCLDRFEQAWRRGMAPQISEFLPVGGNAQIALAELIKLDLEYRWKQFTAEGSDAVTVVRGAAEFPFFPKIEDYLEAYPQLGSAAEVPLDMIAEEFIARQCWGDRPALEEYQTRFAHLGEPLNIRLKEIQQELATNNTAALSRRERQEVSFSLCCRQCAASIPVAADYAGEGMTCPACGHRLEFFSPAAQAFVPLLRVLVQTGLLSPQTLLKLHAESFFVEGMHEKSYAAELVERKIITEFQAEQILSQEAKSLFFGDYLVLEQLGAGGMGVVYRAWHRVMHRQVALKVISRHMLGSSQAVARFQQEVRIAAQLAHPNIVAAYDAREQTGDLFLVLEYVDGADLATIADEHRPPLSAYRVVNYILQAARGLDYAHRQGVIHRDIKPGNLLVSRDGVVKVLDMGLATVAGIAREKGDDRLTLSGQTLGTYSYMSPEQCADGRLADQRSDIYSLGCTLYRLLTGRNPFEGKNPLEIMLAHRDAPIPRLADDGKTYDQALETLCRRMLSKRPEDRPQNMSEVVESLAAILAKTEISAAGENDFGATGFWESSTLPPRRALAHLDSNDTPGMQTRATLKETLALPAQGQLPAAGSIVAVTKAWLQRGNGWQRASIPPWSLAAISTALLLVAIVWLKGSDQRQQLTEEKVATQNDMRSADVASESPSDVDNDSTTFVSTDTTRGIWDEESDPVKYVNAEAGGYRSTLVGVAENPLVAVAVSPRDPVTVAGDYKGNIFIWDLEKSTLRARFAAHGNGVTDIHFLPAGDRFITASEDATAKLWRLDTQKCELTFAGHGDAISAAAISPDGHTLWTASRDKTVRAWDMKTGRSSATLEAEFYLTMLRLAPDGKNLATTGFGGYASIWDVESRQPANRIRRGGTALGESALAYSHSGEQILLPNGLDSKLAICDAHTGELMEKVDVGGSVARIAVSDDDTLYALAKHSASTKTIEVWSLHDQRRIAELTGHSDHVKDLVFVPGSHDLISVGRDNTLRLWSTRRGHEVRCLAGHGISVKDVSGSASGSQLVSGGLDNRVYLWDLASVTSLQLFGGHTGCVNAVVLVPKTTWLLSGSDDATVRMWDWKTEQPVHTFDVFRDRVVAVAADPTGNFVLTASSNEPLRMWDLRGRKVLHELRHHQWAPSCVEFSQTNNLALSADSSEIIIWDVSKDPVVLHKLERSRGNGVSAASFNHQADLVAGSAKNEIHLWSLPPVQEFSLHGHEAEVTSVAFSPDGSKLVSGDKKGFVKVWRLDTKEVVLELRSHPSEVTKIAFVQQGSHLVTSGQDGMIRIWETPNLPAE